MKMLAAFKNFHISTAGGLQGPPRNGQYVSAKFSEDDQWYRAKVKHVDREKKKAEVYYIDYGNTETIDFNRLRPLSEDKFSVQKMRPIAIDAVLSFIQFPMQKPYDSEAYRELSRMVVDKDLVCNVDYTAPDGTLHITVYDPTDSGSKNPEQSINAEMVYQGLAMVPKKLKHFERAYPDVLKMLKGVEEGAKDQRRQMWEYGGKI